MAIPRNNYHQQLLSITLTNNRLTELMTRLDATKKEADTITEEMFKTSEAESVTSDMTQIHQGIKDKRTVSLPYSLIDLQ